MIERLFGIFKRRFRVFTRPLEYTSLDQARLISALAALHNFIQVHDPNEVTFTALEGTQSLQNGPGDVENEEVNRSHYISPEERQQAARTRDRIALDMWDDYQRELQRRSSN